MANEKSIWIIAEQVSGSVASSYYELLGKISSLYETGDAPEFCAVVLGAINEQAIEQLTKSGANKVVSIVHEKLAEYHPEYYVEALYAAATELKPDGILVPASQSGGELAPGVSVKLDTGLVAHCAEMTRDADGMLHFLVPAFGGKLMADNTIPEARPFMVSVRPGVFDRVELDEAASVELIEYTPAVLDELESAISFVSREVVESDEMSIEDAEVVVCAGLGSAVSGNFDKVRELATKLGAGFGYTRPVSDLGYMPNEDAMIGSSGKTIKPKLYLGFGNSGAGQHVCGIKDAGIIINVNNDEEAACFDVSNYKVVSDCGAFLDALLELVG